MIQPTNTQQAYPQGGANAVSINIYNPQAYGAPAAQQQVPYAYSNSIYQMPQASLYAPQQGFYQPYLPMQAPVQQLPAYTPFVQPQQFEMPQSQALAAPAPQEMPISVMQPEQQLVQQPVVQQPEIQETPVQVAQTIDTEGLIQGLKNADADKRADAINQIAVYAQEAPEVALQVVSEPIMNSLIDIIKEDTTKLEGPTDKQIEIAEKITKGEQLTPEEDKLSEQLSPRDKANKNRIFALYTLAMIQKLQRDELNQYIENQKANGEQPIPPLAINDLAGYNDIVNIIKNDARPEVKVAAIQALGYVAETQDKAKVDEVLADSLKSNDEVVKNAAIEATDKLAGTTQG